jgi:antitoxin YefM
MRVVNFSEARNSLKTVMDQVIDDADYTVITRRDAPDAVLMSLDTFNGLMETVHLLKSPANAAHLARSIEPEPLKANFSGFWSRRIDDSHRLVYCTENTALVIIACRYHYQ